MIKFRDEKFVNEAHWAAFTRGYLAKMHDEKKDANPFDEKQTPYYFDLWIKGWEKAKDYLRNG
jgi:ribosome modulation factor